MGTMTNLENEITSLNREDLFGYTISIVNIGTNADGTPNATVKITAK